MNAFPRGTERCRQVKGLFPVRLGAVRTGSGQGDLRNQARAVKAGSHGSKKTDTYRDTGGMDDGRGD